jgi:hypothetical protein
MPISMLEVPHADVTVCGVPREFYAAALQPTGQTCGLVQALSKQQQHIGMINHTTRKSCK